MVRRYDTYRWPSGGLVGFGWVSFGRDNYRGHRIGVRATKSLVQAMVWQSQVDSRDDGTERGGTGIGVRAQRLSQPIRATQSFQSFANDVGPWLCTARCHRTLDVCGGVLRRSLG